MTEQVRFAIGAEVRGTDGELGRVVWVVVDRAAWQVTHLVVEPEGRIGLGRFLPLAAVGAVDPETGAVQVSLTRDAFDQLESAEVTEFAPGTGGFAEFGPAQLITQPFYTAEPHLAGTLAPPTSQTVVTDAPLPDDADVAVHKARAHAADGPAGTVDGLIIDPGSHTVTHVLLASGHFWGRKEVSIPVSAVKDVGADGIHFSLSRQEIGDLPPADVGRG